MSDNNKNVLQIYCQRSKLPLPVYKQNRNDEGLWVSSVTFSYNGKDVTYVGAGCDRKSQADISAAGVAVESIGLGEAEAGARVGAGTSDEVIVVNQAHAWTDFCQTAKRSTAPGSKITMYVLIDYENVNSLQMLNNVYEDEDRDKVEILKFLSYNHHMADKGTASHIVHSAGSDSVDHAISMYVGMLLANMSQPSIEPVPIIILTGDGFGERVQNMTQWVSFGESRHIIVIHLRSEASCVKTLESYGYIQTNKRIQYVEA